MFFKIVRTVLGNLILFFDAIFPPRRLKRSAEAQAVLDEKTENMALYQFKMCPFCVKIRRVIRRQNLKIELRDALGNETFAKELVEEGGKRQVPCLRIEENGKVTWLYESDAIKAYLEAL